MRLFYHNLLRCLALTFFVIMCSGVVFTAEELRSALTVCLTDGETETPQEKGPRIGAEVITDAQFKRAYALARLFADENCLTPWSRPSSWLHELAHHFGEENEAVCRRFELWAVKRQAR